MAEKLVVISDKWGAKKGLWIASYFGYLQQYYDIVFHDCQQLGNVDVSISSEENIDRAFNEKAIVSENRLTVIPSNFDMRTAPLFGCAVTSGFGIVNNDAKVKIGQSVLIFGVGGIGLNVAQASSMVSAYPIIGIDIHKHKIDMGKKFGLTHGLTTNSKNLNKEIYSIIGEKGADITVDTTGNARVIEQAYELTAPDGKTILAGVPKNKITIYSKY